MSSRKTFELLTDVDTDFNQFKLTDPYSTRTLSELAATDPAAATASPRTIATSGPGGILLFTHHDLAEPTVRCEVWDNEPPAPDGTWPEHFNGSFIVEHPHLVLGSITASPTDRQVPLARAGPSPHASTVAAGRPETRHHTGGRSK